MPLQQELPARRLPPRLALVAVEVGSNWEPAMTTISRGVAKPTRRQLSPAGRAYIFDAVRFRFAIVLLLACIPALAAVHGTRANDRFDGPNLSGAAPPQNAQNGTDEVDSNPKGSGQSDVEPTSRGQISNSSRSKADPGSAASEPPASTQSPSRESAGSASPSQPRPLPPRPAAITSGDPAQAEPDVTPEPEPPRVVGEPLAPGMIELLQREIVAGLQRRRIEDRFARFRAYAGQCLDRSAGRYTGSELTGNCRLRWYDWMLRNPLSAPAQAEEFTRNLHEAIVFDANGGLAIVFETARQKMDLPERTVTAQVEVDSPEAALEAVRDALLTAQVEYCRALEPLSKTELGTLDNNLYLIFTQQTDVGHTVINRSMARRLCDLLEKMDRDALHAAAEALVPLSDPVLLDQLATLPQPDASEAVVPGANGIIARRVDTPCGTIVIGGRGANTYRLDEMAGVSAVIDLGGEDTYLEGTVSRRRPVLVVLDLGGDDEYVAQRPGTQGSGILGVSMLVDRAGNDVYRARDVAQASCLGGVGILIDHAGDDTYVGLRRVQACALAGLGVLIDRAGNDRYHAAMWSQGFGAPMGFGLLDDLDGNDHYYTGGMYPDSYDETPGYEGWGQGIGAGLRQVANGGLGMIFDGGGDDTYQYDYLSHGGGYWCGMGFARDFGGNDQRLGATKRTYRGGTRTEREFQRFSNGYGCHYSLGFCFDDKGDDLYTGNIMCVGFAWDCAVGYLCDFGGNDTYNGTQGNGAQAGLGVLFDYSGDDTYNGYRQGRASGGMTYHNLPEAGGNFSFLVDYGGEDKYGSGARNNSYLQRSSAGGFLIDRPARDETTQTAEKPSNTAATGS